MSPPAEPGVYLIELSDYQWVILGPLIQVETGQPGKIDWRAIVNAIFYQLRTTGDFLLKPR